MNHAWGGRARARAATKRDGSMNKMEQARRDELKAMMARGEIVGWWFEPCSFRLADRTTYTPDFRVLYPCGRVVYEEVKGHWEDDARVKIKVCASIHPYEFVALTKRAKRDGGGWNVEVFKGWKTAEEGSL